MQNTHTHVFTREMAGAAGVALLAGFNNLHTVAFALPLLHAAHEAARYSLRIQQWTLCVLYNVLVESETDRVSDILLPHIFAVYTVPTLIEAYQTVPASMRPEMNNLIKRCMTAAFIQIPLKDVLEDAVSLLPKEDKQRELARHTR